MRFLGLTAARAVGQTSSGIAQILVARWAGPAEFGQFSVVFAILLTVSGVLTLGLPVFTLRAAVLGREQAVGFALFLNLLTSIGAALIGIAIVVFGTWIGMSFWLIALMAAGVAFEKNVEPRISLGTEIGRGRLVNWTLAARGVVILALVVIGQVLGLSTIAVFITSRFLILGLSGAILTISVRGWRLSSKPPLDGSLESLAGIAATASVGAIMNLEKPVVEMTANITTAGMYSAIRKVAIPVGLLAGSLAIVLMGPVARGSARKARKALPYIAVTASIGLLVGIVLSVWSEPLVVLVLGDQYLPAAAAFGWLIAGLPAIGMLPILVTLMQAHGMANAVAWNTGILIPMSLLAIGLGAWLSGVTGAAIGFNVLLWARFAALLVIAMRQIGRK
jgi:O-antigen/teichoic acid export membrane protein